MVESFSEKNLLILTVGLPRSGKSTWAKRAGYPVVNPDAIRLALHGRAFAKEAEPFVWAVARTMVRHHFAYRPGSIVVLDACSITPERRDEWDSPSEWDLRYAVFNVPLEECLERARRSQFPEDVVVDMHRRMVLPYEFDPKVMLWHGHREAANEA